MTTNPSHDGPAGPARALREAHASRLTIVVVTVFVVGVVALDLVIDRTPVMIGLLAVAPIITIPRGNRATTVWVSIVCVILAAVSGVWNDNLGTSTYTVRLLSVAAIGGVSTWAVIVRIRSRAEVERQRGLYETLLRAQSEAGQGMALLDGETIVYANQAASEILGRGPEALRSLSSYLEVIAPDRQQELGAWIAALVEGRDVPASIETVGRHADGRLVDLEVSAQPVTGMRGRTPGVSPVVVVGRDITRRKQDERERAELLEGERSARLRLEESHRRMSVLARAGAALEGSLDLGRTLPAIADMIVREVADACTIEVDLPDRPIPPIVRTRPGLDGTQSRVLSLPLLSGSAVLGTMAVGRRTLDEDDDQLIRELARRVALAVANARLYSERDHVARTLQRSLLPPSLPELGGYSVGAAFRPAGTGNEVGGDFYDVFPLAPGQWAMVIGDVCGKGADAAAVTALVRYSLRTIATQEQHPSEVLAQVNDVLLRHGTSERFCTVVLARIQEGDEGRVTISNGGHPPPVEIRDGVVTEVSDLTGTLLGVVPDPRLRDRTLALGPGDAIVLYTDGVTEARRPDGVAVGTEGLLRAARAVHDADPQAIADHLADLGNGGEAGQRDDIAVLVLRRDGAPPPP